MVVEIGMCTRSGVCHSKAKAFHLPRLPHDYSESTLRNHWGWQRHPEFALQDSFQGAESLLEDWVARKATCISE